MTLIPRSNDPPGSGFFPCGASVAAGRRALGLALDAIHDTEEAGRLKSLQRHSCLDSRFGTDEEHADA
jgi:hypothetical protein